MAEPKRVLAAKPKFEKPEFEDADWANEFQSASSSRKGSVTTPRGSGKIDPAAAAAATAGIESPLSPARKLSRSASRKASKAASPGGLGEETVIPEDKPAAPSAEAPKAFDWEAALLQADGAKAAKAAAPGAASPPKIKRKLSRKGSSADTIEEDKPAAASEETEEVKSSSSSATRRMVRTTSVAMPLSPKSAAEGAPKMKKYHVLEKMKDGTAIGMFIARKAFTIVPLYLSDDCSALVWFVRGYSVTQTPTLLFLKNVDAVEIGATSPKDDSGNSFTIWFDRRRQKIVLSALSPQDFAIWTTGLNHLLENQRKGAKAGDIEIFGTEPTVFKKYFVESGSPRKIEKSLSDFEAAKAKFEELGELAINLTMDQTKFYEYVMLGVDRLRKSLGRLKPEELSEGGLDYAVYRFECDLICLDHLLGARS